LVITYSACKKTNSDATSTSESTVQSDDQSTFSSETDAVANDADLAIEANPSISGKIETSPICDATVVLDSNNVSKTITITYNGSNCAASRTRTGAVILSVPKDVKWKDAGAVLSVTYQNLKVTRLVD